MTYGQTGSIRETARRWHTSRQVVRKWVTRYQAEGMSGMGDRSRRPHTSPQGTPAEIEQQVLEAWQKTGYGRHRLALYLRAHGLCLSPHTIRHVLRRGRPPQKRNPRKPLYPAMWAWEQEEPFSLLQTDVKDIHDKQALGTERTTHLHRQRLPRYQWTACDGRTRLRFLAYTDTALYVQPPTEPNQWHRLHVSGFDVAARSWAQDPSHLPDRLGPGVWRR